MSFGLLREFASYPAVLGKLLRHKKVMEWTRVPYGGHKDQYLLYFAPSAPAKDKSIIYIHGGGWNSGTPAMFTFIGQYFALAGYHCILPGYRKTPQYRYPAQIEDVCAGCRKGMEYLEEQGANGSRTVVVGSSAGAHLGALLCYDAELQRRFGIDPERLAGFAGLGGVYDFAAASTWSLDHMIKDLFSPGYDREKAEPIHRLTPGQKVPMLVIHGKSDGVVGYRNAADFCARAQAMGIPAGFYTVPPKGDTHSVYSAGIFLETRDSSPALDRLLNWMEEL